MRDVLEDLIGSGVIADAKMAYFDVRPSAHLPTVELLDEVAVGRRRIRVARGDELLGEERQHDHDEDRECGALEESAHVNSRPSGRNEGRLAGVFCGSARIPPAFLRNS